MKWWKWIIVCLVGVQIPFADHLLAQEQIVWQEDFEDVARFEDEWFTDGVQWYIGVPSDGAHSGQNVVGTVLNGQYLASSDEWLYKFQPISVPISDDFPRLQFWHWFEFGQNDYGLVKVRLQGDQEWVDLSNRVQGISTSWTKTVLDLQPYAGQNIDIAWFFHSEGSDRKRGWMVDDLSLVIGQEASSGCQDFENGLGSWSVEGGSWEVSEFSDEGGNPNPLSRNNTSVAGIQFCCDYLPGTEARLVSPILKIPPVDQEPHLDFSQWFDMKGPDDFGHVEIRVTGEEWIPLGDPIYGESPIWTPSSISLSKFGGQSVQISFLFRSNSDQEVGSGWFLDDICLATGHFELSGTETFDNGWNGWYATGGYWEIGSADLSGESTNAPNHIAGTLLSHATQGLGSSILVSPLIQVPSDSVLPRVRWKQKYDFEPLGDDLPFEVKVSVFGRQAGFSRASISGDPDYSTELISPSSNGNVSSLLHIKSEIPPPDRPLQFNARLDKPRLTTQEDYRKVFFDNGNVANATVTITVFGKETVFTMPNWGSTRYVFTFDMVSAIPGLSFQITLAGRNTDVPAFTIRNVSSGSLQSVEAGVFGRKPGGPWIPLTQSFAGTSKGWVEQEVSLQDFIGGEMQIGFQFSRQSLFPTSGWFIDDIRFSGKLPTFALPASFESNEEAWTAETSAWETGVRLAHGLNAKDGLFFALGNLKSEGISRLYSPFFEVPLSLNEPALRFWQAFQFSGSAFGRVEIGFPDGSWKTLQGTIFPAVFRKESLNWNVYRASLEKYRGQLIRLGFHLEGTQAADNAAWLIDAITLKEADLGFNGVEGFDEGWSGWHATQGVWEIGTNHNAPNLPNGHGGVAATRLRQNYPETANSMLISPAFEVPSKFGHTHLKLHHYHRFRVGDKGQILFRTSDGQFQVVSDAIEDTNHVWSEQLFDFSEYAGNQGRLIFAFTAEDRQGFYDSDQGWYIDSVDWTDVIPGFQNPETFENGLGGWRVEGGVWQVGRPSSGPSSAYSGLNVAGTNLQGNYPINTLASLLSPSFMVPDASLKPRLRFRHWFNFVSGHSGKVYVKDGTGGKVQLGSAFSGSSLDRWVYPLLDLSPYAGKIIQIVFELEAPGGSSAVGWYLDDIKVETELLQKINPFIYEVTEGENVLVRIQDRVPDGLELGVRMVEANRNALGSAMESGEFPMNYIVDSAFGLFTWQTQEIHGPGRYVFDVTASSPLTDLNPLDSETFEIVVKEINEKPGIQPVSDIYYSDESFLQFQILADDKDLPSQHLTYTLEQGPPQAGVDPNTGEGGWLIGEASRDVAYEFVIRVTDDGEPPLSETVSFRAVPESMRPRFFKILSVRLLNDELVIQFESPELGKQYQMYVTDELSINGDSAAWEPLGEPIQFDVPPFEVRTPIQEKGNQFMKFILVE